MENALVDISKRRETILQGFSGTSDIEKSRSGVYSDNADNRSKKRVGQKYGSKKEEESGKTPSTKKTEDPKKSVSKKEEKTTSKDTKKVDDSKKEGVAKTSSEHAKDTPTEDLQHYVDTYDEEGGNDPELLADAKKELSSRSREGKSPAELQIMAIDKEMEGLQESIDEAIGIHETMKNEKLKEMVYDSVTEGDAEMAKLKEKKVKLEKKAKKENQPKIEKDPKAYAAVASVEDLTKKTTDLSKQVQEAINDGNFTSAQKLVDEQNLYSDEIAKKLKAASKTKK